MKAKKSIILGLIVCMLTATFAACGSDAAKDTTEDVAQEATEVTVQEPADTEENESMNTYPVTVTDQAGREVVIEKEPETIVSGYYIATSMLIALGQEEKMVGVENNPEKRPVYALSAPEILELPGMGTVKEFDLETCAKLQPDLVVLPMKLKEMTESLDQLGIPVVIVNPETQELFEETITLLGTAVGNTERAQELLSFVDGHLSEMEDAVKDAERPRVYLSGNSSFLLTAGPAMYQNSLIVNAGGENVANDLTDTYWAEISYEQLLAWDPEYIILASGASYTVEDVLADENLKNCQAVKAGQVYQMPDEIECFDSPVPASVLGNLWLASILHPDEYPSTEYEQAQKEFYETFYGFTPEL